MFRILFLMIFWVSSLSAYDLGIISMFRNEGPYIKEWVEYHLFAGVEHFWLYDNGSTDNSLEVLQPYIDAGIIEVTSWPTPLESSVIPTQISAFKDGIRRTQGVATWVALIDIDEFILPRKERSIKECLKKHFNKSSAVYVNWRNFGTGGVTVPKGDPLLPRLTACSLPDHSYNFVGKSIIRPETVNIDEVWYIHHFPLLRGRYMNGEGKTLSFQGVDLQVERKHHDRFIRINHYILRDEWFFHEVRMKSGGNLQLYEEQYILFSLTHDDAIIKFFKH